MWAKSGKRRAAARTTLRASLSPGNAGFIGEVALDPPHQIVGTGQYRPARRETLARIIADFGIEGDLTAGINEMHRRIGPMFSLA